MIARLALTVVVAAVTLVVPGVVRAGDDAVVPVPKPWSVYAATGLQYDSNVTLDPSGEPLPGATGDPEDGAAVFRAGGRYDLADSERWQADLEYDFYQTVHFRLQDYDLRSNRVLGSVGYALTPMLWTGVQAGYQHYALGSDAYSGAPVVTPFVSLVEGGWGLTQLVYEHAQVSYFSAPFEDVRDGPTDTVGLSQTLYWGSRYLMVAYEFGSERPTSSAGDDYRERYHQGSIGVGFSPGWRTTIDLTYLFRYENYLEPNSVANFQRERRDLVSQFAVSARRAIGSYLSVGLTYYGTIDDSNIAAFQYRRNIVAAEVLFAY